MSSSSDSDEEQIVEVPRSSQNQQIAAILRYEFEKIAIQKQIEENQRKEAQENQMIQRDQLDEEDKQQLQEQQARRRYLMAQRIERQRNQPLYRENEQQDQVQIQVVEENLGPNTKYFGGLLDRNDSFLTKILKLLCAIPFLPFVILYNCLYSCCICTCDFYAEKCIPCCDACCQAIYQVLEACSTWLVDRIVDCLVAIVDCCTYIYEKFKSCMSWICGKICTSSLLFSIDSCLSFFGRIARVVIKWMTAQIMRIFFKLAHFRMLISYLTIRITLPIFLRCLVPIYIWTYNSILIPVWNTIIRIVKWIFNTFIRIVKWTATQLYDFLIYPICNTKNYLY